MWEATCLGAPSDAVEPAVLLSIQEQRRVLGSSKPAQFLFNVPEGFARLVLEHKVRPGTGLRAVMATNTQPGAVGGLGGLILRLKQDGHGQVELLGPRGLGTSLEGVAEFVHWKHPHITLRELHPTTPSTRGIQPPPQTQQDGVMGAMSTAMAALQKRVALSTAVREEPLPEGTCFEDDLLQVAPLWHHDLLWKPPTWMTAAPKKAGSKQSGAPAAPSASKSAHHAPPQLGDDKGTKAGQAQKAGQHRADSHTHLGSSSSSSSSSSESSSEEDAEKRGKLNGVVEGRKSAGDATAKGSSDKKDSSSGEEESSSEEEEEEEEESSSSDSSSSSSSSSEEESENGIPGMRNGKGQQAGMPDVFSKLDQLFAASARGGRGGYVHAGRMGGSRGGRRRGSAHRRPSSKGSNLHVAAESFKGGMGGMGGMGPLLRQSAAQQGLKREVLSHLRDHAPLSSAAGSGGGANAAAEGGVGVRGSSSTKRSSSARGGAGLQSSSPPKKRKASAAAATSNAAPASHASAAAAAAAPATNVRHQPPETAGNVSAATQHLPLAPLPSSSASGSLTGYVCHVRGDGTLLLMLCVPSIMLLASAQQHPCLSSLACKQSRLRRRVAAVLHLTPHHVASARPYQQWLRSLPGQQVLVGHGCSSSSSSSSGCTTTTSTMTTNTSINTISNNRDDTINNSSNGNKGGSTAAAGVPDRANAADGQGDAALGSAAHVPGVEGYRQERGVPVQVEQQQQQPQKTGFDSAQDGTAQGNMAQGDTALGPQHQQARQFVSARLAQLKQSQDKQGRAAGNEGLGFLAAARVTARLNLISPLLFPLPHALLHSPCPVPSTPPAPQSGTQAAAPPCALGVVSSNRDTGMGAGPKRKLPLQHNACLSFQPAAPSAAVAGAGRGSAQGESGPGGLNTCGPSKRACTDGSCMGKAVDSGGGDKSWPVAQHMAEQPMKQRGSAADQAGEGLSPDGMTKGRPNEHNAGSSRPVSGPMWPPKVVKAGLLWKMSHCASSTGANAPPGKPTPMQFAPESSAQERAAAAAATAAAAAPVEGKDSPTAALAPSPAAPAAPPAEQGTYGPTQPTVRQACLTARACSRGVYLLDSGNVPAASDVAGLQMELLETLGDPLVKQLQDLWQAAPELQHTVAARTFSVPQPQQRPPSAPAPTAIAGPAMPGKQQQQQQQQQHHHQQQQQQQRQKQQQGQQQDPQQKRQRREQQGCVQTHRYHHGSLPPHHMHCQPNPPHHPPPPPLNVQLGQPVPYHQQLQQQHDSLPAPPHSAPHPTHSSFAVPPGMPQAPPPPLHGAQGYYVWVPGPLASATSLGSDPAHLPPLSFPDPFPPSQRALDHVGPHPPVVSPHPSLACPPPPHHQPCVPSSQPPPLTPYPSFPTAHAPHLAHQSHHQPIPLQAPPAQMPQPLPPFSRQHAQPTQHQPLPYHLQHSYQQHQQQPHPHTRPCAPAPPPATRAHPPSNNRSAAERLRSSIKGGGGSSSNGDSDTTLASHSALASPSGAAAGTAGTGSEAPKLESTVKSPAAALEASATVAAAAGGVHTVPEVNGPHSGTLTVPPSAGGTSVSVGCGSGRTDVPLCLHGPLAEGTALMFLGTGSAEPSKYRAGSAILLKLPGSMGSLLMDCGEGSWGQMLRCLGPEVARQQVAALRCVWVSHKHADHALGLSGLLAARPAGAPPLLVVGPWAVKRWLQRLHDSHGYHTHFVHCREFRQPWDVANNAQQSIQAEAVGPRGLGLVRWQSVPVDHCPDAYALVMEHQHGWKLVYSGDTRPCPALVRAGAGATLLIHEATFEPELVHQAVSKRHSTSAEALQAAKDMKAYSTILTHFSQRYPRVPAGLGLESESEDPDGQDTHASGDEEQGCGHCACGGSVSEEDELEGEGEGLLGPRSRSEGEEAMCAAGGVAGSGLEVRPSKAQENGACSKEKAKEEQGSENLGTGLEGKDQGQAQQQQQQFQSQAPDQEEAQGLRTAPAMVAFDGMLVPLSVLPHLPMVGPLVAKVLKRAEQLQEKQEQEQLQLEQQQRHQQSMATLGMSVAA